MMTRDELVLELMVCNSYLTSNYAAPEQVKYAYDFVKAVSDDLDLTLDDMINDSEKLTKALKEKARFYTPKYTGDFIRLDSSHDILGDYLGGFDYMPEVGKPFEFVTDFINMRNITTSTVKDIVKRSDHIFDIITKNSTYRIIVEKEDVLK